MPDIERCEHRWHHWANHKCFLLKNHPGKVHQCACGNKHKEK